MMPRRGGRSTSWDRISVDQSPPLSERLTSHRPGGDRRGVQPYPERVTRRLGLLQVCAAGVLWGTGGLVVTVLHERDGLGAMTASAWRMGLAALVLVAFALLTGHRRAVRRALRDHPAPVMLIGCGTALYQGLYFVSVLMAGVTVATVVSLGLAPVLAAAWEHARARTRPSRHDLAILAAALVGLVLISTASAEGTSGPQDRPALGLLLAMAAGATYAATTVAGHTLARQVPPVALTTCATTAGALVLSPFLVVAALTGEPVAGDSAASWALLAYLGVATMALAYGLLYAGLRTTTGSAATIATLLEPISAAALAVALLGERIGPAGLVGAALILAAVAGLRASARSLTVSPPRRPSVRTRCDGTTAAPRPSDARPRAAPAARGCGRPPRPRGGSTSRTWPARRR